jgi:hypothetical protein
MRTVEELEKEVARLSQDLAFARDDASQQAQKAKALESDIREAVAQVVFTELVASGGGNVASEMAVKAFKAARLYMEERSKFYR